MELNLILAYLGVFAMVGISGIGSAFGLFFTGQATIGAMRKDPTQMGKYIGLSALPASQGLYGFIGFFLAKDLINPEMTFMTSVAILMMGLLVGIVGMASANRQGRILANGIAATADGHNVLASTMVMAAFPELYAILGLLVSILVFSGLA
ncbi:MAG: ATPase [Bacteroidales bacterium]|uniref:ATPase n=1 Tax=Porphyromonas sp. TaxID=1924944 RepID=UPI00297058B8|nr:ATPase [Porphyromonas sp.]MDD7437242.1 ATPase [Bacteroidales bacterium]MDY3066493.1 ATPase [Porphyromonas sp.]